VCVGVCVCVCVFVCVCVCVCVYACIHIYAIYNIRIYLNVYVYIYMYINIHLTRFCLSASEQVGGSSDPAFLLGAMTHLLACDAGALLYFINSITW